MSDRLFQHTKQQEYCPQCGSVLHIKQGKKGLFLGCSAYPECDYLKPLHHHSEHKILKQLEECCPQCGDHLAVKQGSFGIFIGCNGYPNCHFIVNEEPEAEVKNTPCPECGKGELIPRRGRQGKTFYGCNQYPHCKFTVPYQPQPQLCPKCGANWTILKNPAKSDRTFLCVNKHCQAQFKVDNENKGT